MEKLISVIIPTYNRAKTIIRSLQSVVAQNYKNIEIIVVNDGSTDSTEKILQSFNDNRINVIKHSKNMGAAAARNTGIRAATGDYIAFQDSDDYWFPEKLEIELNAFNYASKSVGIVYSDMYRITRDNQCKYWKSPEARYGILINEKSLEYQACGIGLQTVLIKKDCFDKVGFFDETFPRFIDLEFFIRAAKEYDFYHIKKPLVKYYFSQGISENFSFYIAAEEMLLKKYFTDIIKNKRFLANRYYRIGAACYFNNDFKKGRIYLIKAYITDPFNFKFFSALVLSYVNNHAYPVSVKIYRTLKNDKEMSF